MAGKRARGQTATLMAQDSVGTGGQYLSLLDGLWVLHGDADLDVSLQSFDKQVELLFEGHSRYLDSQVVKRLGIVVDTPPWRRRWRASWARNSGWRGQ
jgi:hypothetical protein